MADPFLEVAAVFAVGLTLQLLFDRRRVAVAIITTLGAFALMVVTVGWQEWNHDALWIIGFTVALIEYAAASIVSGLVAYGLKRVLRSGQPNSR